MQKNANDIGNGKGMQLTMYAQVRLGCTIHIFIIGVDALKGCVESARRTEEGRRDDACLAEEEEVGIMDIFIIGGRGKADGRQTKGGRSNVPTTTFRYTRTSLQLVYPLSP